MSFSVFFTSMMSSHFLLAAVHIIGVISQNEKRAINWWINIEGNPTPTSTDIANVQTITAHKQLFSQIQIAWGPGCTDNGDLSAWWIQNNTVATWLGLYKPLKIPIVPAVVCITNATIMHQDIYSNASGFANALVDIAKHYGFAGFTFDYEPQWPPDRGNEAAVMYSAFLSTVNQIFRDNDLVLTVWVADWSDALNDYGLLGQSGVNALQDMETYGGGSMEQELKYMNRFFSSIISDGVDHLPQAAVGLGCYKTDFWTFDSLNNVLRNITHRGGSKIAIFRLLMDGTNNWPPEYWWDSLDMFMNGTL